MLLSQLLMLIYGHPYMFHFYIQADCVNYLSIPRMLVEAPVYNHTSLSLLYHGLLSPPTPETKNYMKPRMCSS